MKRRQIISNKKEGSTDAGSKATVASDITRSRKRGSLVMESVKGKEHETMEDESGKNYEKKPNIEKGVHNKEASKQRI